jgi:hypothetical protein
MSSVTRKDLRKFIARHFDSEDLEVICFDLGIDYEEVGDGSRLSKLVVNMIRHVQQHGRYEDLVLEIREQRPEQFKSAFERESLIEADESEHDEAQVVDRSEIVRQQVLWTLERAAVISKDFLGLVSHEMDLQWLTRIEVMGDREDSRYATRLILDIDWIRHRRAIEETRNKIHINKSWPDGSAPEVFEATQTFIRFIQNHSLATCWLPHYTKRVESYRKLKSNMNLSLCSRSSIRKPTDIFSRPIQELPEIQVSLALYL